MKAHDTEKKTTSRLGILHPGEPNRTKKKNELTPKLTPGDPRRKADVADPQRLRELAEAKAELAAVGRVKQHPQAARKKLAEALRRVPASLTGDKLLDWLDGELGERILLVPDKKAFEKSRRVRLDGILAWREGDGHRAFDKLVADGCDKVGLEKLLLRDLLRKVKPLAGAARRDYKQTLAKVARDLRHVEADLSPVCHAEEKKGRERVERFTEARLIALEVMGDPLRLANQCRDLARALERQMDGLPRAAFSPRDWYWLEIIGAVREWTRGDPHYTEVSTLASAMLEVSGEPGEVSEGKLKMLDSRHKKFLKSYKPPSR